MFTSARAAHDGDDVEEASFNAQWLKTALSVNMLSWTAPSHLTAPCAAFGARVHSILDAGARGSFSRRDEEYLGCVVVGGPVTRGGGGGDGFMGPNIKVFRNGHPVNFQQKMQKPIPIVKNIKVSLEQSYNGSNIPIEIERWIHINNSKNVETETIYITIPKGIDNNEMIVIPNKGNIISAIDNPEISLGNMIRKLNN